MTGGQRQRKPSIDRSNTTSSKNSSKSNGRGGSGSDNNRNPTNDGHNNNGHNNSRHHHPRRDRSNSHSSHNGSINHSPHPHHHHHNHHPRKPQSKDKLWKGSLNVDVGDSVIVQMVGFDSHTGYARVDPSCHATPDALSSIPILKVIEVMVDEERRHVARTILEKGLHVETSDHYPSATGLLDLGAVWLLNETLYAAGENAHARRLRREDAMDTPEWKDMTLRVHYHPERFFVAHERDWGKYCRGLLLDGCTSAVVGGRKAHVPMTMLPDAKDGVIIYENNDVGLAVLNKPGGMPCYSTITNHAEDVITMYGAALKQRSGCNDQSKPYLSIPIRVETEMHGLVLAATNKAFCHYMTTQLESKAATPDNGNHHVGGVTKTYRCLVCIKHPNDIDRIENMVNRTIEHYVDVKSPTPKTFKRNKPMNSKNDWQQCHMKILSVGSQSKNFRAACVSSRFSDSNDFTLAHRLWGPNAEHPAEDVGAQFVMQVDVRLVNTTGHRAPHQIRGQLAALGVPIVGDEAYGGGVCEMRMHHHMWTRMAVQICRLEFRLPEWEDGEEGKRTLVSPTETENGEEDRNKCIFHLNTAWWSEYLVDYERHMLQGGIDH